MLVVRHAWRNIPGFERRSMIRSPDIVRHVLADFFLQRSKRSRTILSIVTVLVAWELVGQFILTSRVFFAPLSAVLRSGVELWSTGELQLHIMTSFIEFAIGFLLAAAVGIMVGIAMAISKRTRDYLDPWISGLYSTPSVALAPLFVLWLGLDVWSKVAVIFLSGVFPILVNTLTGIEATDPNLIEVARSFSARRLQVFWKVLLPSAVPFIVAGLRLGVGRAIVGVVVAELFGARAGLGYLILSSQQVFDMAGLFLGVLLLAMAGILSVELLKIIEHKVAPWRHFDLKA
jgi:NitT/TauT family transport system permease protein